MIVELWQEIQKLRAALDTDESKPNSSPAKTSSNSSTPPSKGFKPNIKPKPSKIEGVKRQKSIGRAGGERHLHPEPDQIIVAQIKSCPQCSETVTATSQKLQAVYDKIELPPIRPIVTRIELYGGRCPCCQTEYLARHLLEWNQAHHLAAQFKAWLHICATLMRSATNGCRESWRKFLDSRYPKIAIANLLSTVKTSLDDQVNQILQRLRGKINLLG